MDFEFLVTHHQPRVLLAKLCFTGVLSWGKQNTTVWLVGSRVVGTVVVIWPVDLPWVKGQRMKLGFAWGILFMLFLWLVDSTKEISAIWEGLVDGKASGKFCITAAAFFLCCLRRALLEGLALAGIVSWLALLVVAWNCSYVSGKT